MDTPEFRSAAELFDRIFEFPKGEYGATAEWEMSSGGYGLTKTLVWEGKLAMFIGSGSDFSYYDDTHTVSKKVDYDYGFIPMPKVSEEAEYVSVYNTYGYCIESANPDPQRSAYILSEIGKILNDTSETAVNIRGYLRDAESLEMITEYVRPNSVLPIMVEVRNFVKTVNGGLQCYYADLDTAKSLDEIISTYHPQLQAALDELFEQ